MENEWMKVSELIEILQESLNVCGDGQIEVEVIRGVEICNAKSARRGRSGKIIISGEEA